MRDIIFLPGFLLNLVCLRLKFKPLNRQCNEGFKGGLNFNVQHLRKEKGMASSNLWTIYSMLNSVSKGKYSFNLKQYGRGTILLKSFDVDINQKG